MADIGSTFTSLSRQQFRRYFQPSRIVIGLFPAPTKYGVNPITLCFDMYCSYSPVMMAVAIHNVNASYELAKAATHYVLAVPGESLAKETIYCGTKSMRDMDKVAELGLDLSPGQSIPVPGLARAVANIELTKEHIVGTGDHLLLIGKVRKFLVNRFNQELPLLSIGPDTRGFRVLGQRGIHRIGVVDA